MPDQPNSTEDTQGTSLDQTRRAINKQLPKGGILQQYGAPVGIGAGIVALVEFLGTKPEQSFKLLAQFGPKWVFFTVLIVLVWDISKRALKLVARAVAHVGELAANTGRAADGVQAFAAKSDRTAEEQSRLTAFAVQTSQRAVELSSDNLTATKQNQELLQQLLAKQVPSA